MLAINNLSVSYGQSVVIRDLSFSVGQNEVVAIMGRNGMGKTTLFKSLMGILPARSGSIKLGETELGPLELSASARTERPSRSASRRSARCISCRPQVSGAESPMEPKIASPAGGANVPRVSARAGSREK